MEQLYIFGTGHAAVTRNYNTCFAIRDGEDFFMTDAGGGNRILGILQDMEVPLERIHHIFVTHEHTDHILGIVWMVRMIGSRILAGKYPEPDPMVEIRSAVHSNYAGMVAMLGADNRVYLGREERYHFEGDQPAYYDDSDGSLCFVTDRADMYYFLYGEGWTHTQEEMLGRGLVADQYAEFARLQHGVLRQFEVKRELRFAGQPFQEPEDYLHNAELYEEGQTGNYNMLDGRLDNEPPERPDLTDGQTWEEIRELAPETLPEETAKKPSLMERLKGERPEQIGRAHV